MSNHLSGQTSPYLLQHAENPVDWYPWGGEAFQKARDEDKPIFLSIGYSTCHWCHVMAHESFEDAETADILNRYFVSIKVDKEERPDIDSVYMAVCQAFTGNGGWPMSIFMTPEQRPFFAGTYFPKYSRRGAIGFRDLLLLIHEKWESDRASLLRSAGEMTGLLGRASAAAAQADATLPEKALELYRRSFDREFGGFGAAPKFPAPHNLLFLMQRYEKYGDREALDMAELTLQRMYAGGLFDHIGHGFCRYSTDRCWLVPHFEKMLYDNALLILAYCKAHELTGRALYLDIAEKTAGFVLREMTGPDGGFYSAQDADSEGEEGRFYVFTPDEIERLLGPTDGPAFCERFGITREGNFGSKSIPNLLHASELSESRFDPLLPRLREYRRERSRLHTDDKVLTAWNSLMIAALCALYRRSGDRSRLDAARRAQEFIERELCEGGTLYVSARAGARSGPGFLDDYAAYAFALLSLYDATLERPYLERAAQLVKAASEQFADAEHGGYFLSGAANEQLIFRPKECFDGAMPSGNSLMAYDLVRLSQVLPEAGTEAPAREQLAFMSGEAARYPAGYAMFLTALSDMDDPPMLVTAVTMSRDLGALAPRLPSSAAVRLLDSPTAEYKSPDGEPAFYVCRGRTCLPPMDLSRFLETLASGKYPS